MHEKKEILNGNDDLLDINGGNLIGKYSKWILLLTLGLVTLPGSKISVILFLNAYFQDNAIEASKHIFKVLILFLILFVYAICYWLFGLYILRKVRKNPSIYNKNEYKKQIIVIKKCQKKPNNFFAFLLSCIRIYYLERLQCYYAYSFFNANFVTVISTILYCIFTANILEFYKIITFYFYFTGIQLSVEKFLIKRIDSKANYTQNYINYD